MTAATGDRSHFRWLAPVPPPPPPGEPLAAMVERALVTPTAGAPLAECVQRSPLIIIPDATRATGIRETVAALDHHLDQVGVAAAERTYLIAGGLHRPPTAEELARLIGPRSSGARIAIHDAADEAAQSDLGRTAGGTPVLLNRLLVESPAVILIGGITPHYFAGFTGGWKGIVPAAAGRATILANHRRAVDPARPDGLAAGCREGNLEGNPVHEDLVAAARRGPAPFLVNLVAGATGDPVAVVSGDVDTAHARGVATARAAAALPVSPVDLVVVSTGAPGRERDWIQAHKIVRQGAAYVRDGGVVIARVACRDGLGSDSLLAWLDVPETELAERVATAYTPHGHTALAMRALCRRVRVLLVSELDPALVRRMGMTPAPTVDAALTAAAGLLPAGSEALVIERAGALLPPATSPAPPAPA